LQNYDTDETAWATLVLHGCAKNPDAEPLLIQYAQQVSHPPHHRALVLFVLAMLETDATIFFPLSKWTPKSVRVIVVRILGTLQDKRALSHLIETSRDSHPGLRAHCAWALGEMQDTSALDTLLVLLEDEELRVSLEAIAALGKLNDSRAIPPLLELWAQLEEQKSHMGLVFLGGPHEIFDEWKQTASVVHKSLHQLGVTVAPLTEKEALKTHRINIGP